MGIAVSKIVFILPAYGFPIGGVAAMDIENGGVISPGGIGFDFVKV